LLTTNTPTTGTLVQWELSQPLELYSHSLSKWRPAVVVGITEHSTGHYLQINYWRSPRSAQVSAECVDALSDSVRPLSSNNRTTGGGVKSTYESRKEWASGSEVECFSASRQRWYLATVTKVIREEDDSEDWLEVQWLIVHSSTERHVYGKEVQRSSELLRHRYPHSRPQRTGRGPITAMVSECTVIRMDTEQQLDDLGIDSTEDHVMTFSETEESEMTTEEESDYDSEEGTEDEEGDESKEEESQENGYLDAERGGNAKPFNDHFDEME